MIDGIYVERITSEIVCVVRDLHIDRLVDEYPHNKKGEQPKLDEAKLKDFESKLFDFEEMVEEIISVALLKEGEFYFKTKFNYQDEDAKCLNASIENALYTCFGKNANELFKRNVNLMVSGDINQTKFKLEVFKNGYFQRIDLQQVKNQDYSAQK